MHYSYCPFCFSKLQLLDKCSNCEKEIPPSYQDYARILKPLVVSVVGFPQHGKTVFISSLFYMFNSLSKYWPGFYKQALNQETLRRVEDTIRDMDNGKLPDITRTTFFETTCLLLLNKIPWFGNKLLLFYDVNGEDFNEDRLIAEKAPFIQYSEVVFFLISIDDLIKDEKEGKEKINNALFHLLNTYVLGIRKLKVSENLQKLIIIFTKADVLKNQFKDYPLIQKYIDDNDFIETNWNIENTKKYIRNLKDISKFLEMFTIKELDASEFVNMAKDKFDKVEFSIVSSLGHPPENNRLPFKIFPRRVIDPILWSFFFSDNLSVEEPKKNSRVKKLKIFRRVK